MIKCTYIFEINTSVCVNCVRASRALVCVLVKSFVPRHQQILDV